MVEQPLERVMRDVQALRNRDVGAAQIVKRKRNTRCYRHAVQELLWFNQVPGGASARKDPRRSLGLSLSFRQQLKQESREGERERIAILGCRQVQFSLFKVDIFPSEAL